MKINLKAIMCLMVLVAAILACKCVMENSDNCTVKRFVNSTKRCGRSLKHNAGDFFSDIADDAGDLVNDCKKDVSRFTEDVVDTVKGN